MFKPLTSVWQRQNNRSSASLLAKRSGHTDLSERSLWIVRAHRSYRYVRADFLPVYPMQRAAMQPMTRADGKVRRPFAFINSRIFVRASEEEDGELVGEAQQCVSALLRRISHSRAENGTLGEDGTISSRGECDYLPTFREVRVRCRRRRIPLDCSKPSADAQTAERSVSAIRTRRLGTAGVGFLAQRPT